jgi:Zn-dependent protease
LNVAVLRVFVTLRRMDSQALINGLLMYLCFLPVLTFHEFAHAWVAWKCGDDTARSLGRVTLNPIKHMDVIGTVVLPLAAIFLGAADSQLAKFIIGWGKPVPVNVSNLRNPRRDDTLVALAGPAMNVLLAVVLMGFVKIGVITKSELVVELGRNLVLVSLILCFFNLLPIPPLDGSHVVKNLIGMSHETYYRLCQYGFIVVIVAVQIPAVRGWISSSTEKTFMLLVKLYRIG